MILNGFFYLFTNILIICAFNMVYSRGSIFSIIFLIMCFLTSSAILFLLECEFLALILIMVYVGAVAMLFLFAIMMINPKYYNLQKNLIRYSWPFGVCIGLLVISEIFLIVRNSFPYNPYELSFLTNFFFNWLIKVDTINDMEAIGQLLYTKYVVQFLISGAILLLAVIASTSLTVPKKFNRKFNRKQVAFKQLSRSYRHSLNVFKNL